MNIAVLSLIVIVLGVCVGFIVKALVNLAMPNNGGLKNLTTIVLASLAILIFVYSTFNYLGVVDEPIKQGVFREGITKQKPHDFDLSPPELDIKHITDRERYEQAVKRLNQ